MMRLPALILLLLAATIHASTASPRKDDTATSNANNDQLVDENSHEPSKISLTINVPKTKPKTTASQVQYPKEKEQPSQAKVNSETQPPGANSRLNSQPEQTPGSLMTKRRQLIITKILEQPISDSYKILGLTPSATDEEIKERHHKVTYLKVQLNLPKSNHIPRYSKF